MSQVYDEPIVVRMTVPVGSYPVGTEFGFKDVADAIRALGSSAYFEVVRTQDGDPIPPPTPEDLDEAQKAALARARAARLIRGAEFDPLVPGPGEVIVGSADGPVARDVSEVGGGGGGTVVSSGPSVRIDTVTPYRVQTPPVPTTWETPDGTGVVVHPSVLFLPDGWNGYHWWAAITPYAGQNNQVENPCILVSADGTTWTAAPGVTNPLAPAPTGGFNSDVCLNLSPSGEMLLTYREVVGTASRLRLFRSRDGRTWDGPTTIIESTTGTSSLTSHAIWYSPQAQGWAMLSVHSSISPRVFHRHTAPEITGPWTFDREVPIAPAWEAGQDPWHMDVRRLGDRLVALIQAGGTDGGREFMALSVDDGRSFTRATLPVRERNGYKSALVPTMTASGLTFDTFLGQLDRVDRAMIAPPDGDRLALRQGLGAAGITPYLFGDNFNREDTESGLGTSSSGRAWTTTAGTPYISGGKAVATAGMSRATVDVGLADYEVGGTIGSTGAGTGMLMFRYVSEAEHLRVGISLSTVSVQRIAASNIAETYQQWRDVPLVDRNVRVRAQGPRITVWIDGGLFWSGEITQGQTATKIGIVASAPGITHDDLWCKRLEGEG